jgi:thiamine monophosphate synthase
MSIQLYDTTLRDGSQKEGISFSVVDKLNITRKLDDLGIHLSKEDGLVPIRRILNFLKKPVN